MEIKERILAAADLLSGREVSLGKFESVRALVKGVNPKIDVILEQCSKNLSKIEKLRQGEVIELSVEELLEQTDEQKKRKKAIIFFLRSWKDLRGEVDRVKGELAGSSTSASSLGRILALAKGPLGLVTLAAVVIVIGSQFVGKTSPAPLPKPRTKVIIFADKKILLDSLYVGTGTDCDSPHYHAKDHISVISLDGTKVSDPGGCGFGKVAETPVQEIGN